MKISGVLLFLFVMPVFVLGQNVTDARQSLYYDRYNSALNTLQTILKQEPDNAEAWYLLSQAYLESGKTQLFRDTFRLASQIVTGDPFGMIVKGQLLLQDGKKDSAQVHFDAAIKKTRSKDPVVLSSVARAHISEKSGDGAYAVELLQKAIRRDKKNAALFTMMGDAYRKLGNGTEAYKMYQQALGQDGSYAAAHHKLGRIFLSQNNNIYLKYFNQAVTADPKYAPVYYDLYYHYYFREPAKALEYFRVYVSNSDYKAENDYLLADLLYLNRNYTEAVVKTKELIDNNPTDTLARLYKLLAYSYAGQKDTALAIEAMTQYFSKQADTSVSVKDYELMADLYASTADKKDSALYYYEKVAVETVDTTTLASLYKKLADLSKGLKNYEAHANWLGKYYQVNKNASNLDLFNWGIAHFKAEQYVQADSVFGLYTSKYPEQSFGYYWRARSNALLDSTMEQGLAIPHYQQLISVIEKDTSDATNRKWLIESYGYIAAYETNKEKDYEDAIEYLEKVLQLDPDNKNARDYITLLEKSTEAKVEKNE
jgi:tetratricopeptide (TPR) repeat protein